MRDAEIQAEVPGRAVAMDRGIRAAPTRQTVTTFPIPNWQGGSRPDGPCHHRGIQPGGVAGKASDRKS